MTDFTRTDRSALGTWWWTVDKWSFAAIGLIAACGAILSFAASPAVAEKNGYDTHHYVTRQLIFLGPALALVMGMSLLSPLGVRRVAALMLGGGLLLLAATLVVGIEVKGARRWLDFGIVNLQPSEFVKPAFIIVTAALFAQAAKRNDVRPYALSGALFVLVVGLLVLQPDFGQAMLVALTWGMMVFLAGVSWVWIAGLGLLGVAGIVLAYMSVPHVTSRIDRFLDPQSGDTYQVDRARDAIMQGGFLGQGPGDGVVKRVLPDAHADFVFAVGVEEFGMALGLLLIALFGFIVLRGLMRALADRDHFAQLGAAGLFVMFGLQAMINIGVNVNLLPAKGMTLPFVSYGGSSLLALAMAMGMALALTRRRAMARIIEEYR